MARKHVQLWWKNVVSCKEDEQIICLHDNLEPSKWSFKSRGNTCKLFKGYASAILKKKTIRFLKNILECKVWHPEDIDETKKEAKKILQEYNDNY